MNKRYEKYKNEVDKYLIDFLADKEVFHRELIDSMRYSLLAGGKRLRPILVMEFCRMCGGDINKVLPIACSIEMLHTYSLIHDDLPCMDNDKLRRGKPTNHMVYGETIAVLAGDALQAEAFNTILSSNLSPEIRAECARILASSAGESGICGGQYLDMKGGEKHLDIDRLYYMCNKKTATLIAAACEMGAVAGEGTKNQIMVAHKFGMDMGLAFQIRDDILDEISSDEVLGKSIGSDANSGKTTFYSLLGLENCENIIINLTENAIKNIDNEFNDIEFISKLALKLSNRNH